MAFSSHGTIWCSRFKLLFTIILPFVMRNYFVNYSANYYLSVSDKIFWIPFHTDIERDIRQNSFSPFCSFKITKILFGDINNANWSYLARKLPLNRNDMLISHTLFAVNMKGTPKKTAACYKTHETYLAVSSNPAVFVCFSMLEKK